jgi:FtsP/CotA-like multicopper oxidase with cupredoxin domain
MTAVSPGTGGGGMGGGWSSSADTARAGETEDWAITNTSSMDHPFHLHAWPFRVISRTSGPRDVAGWKDTVNVPAKSSVTVRVPFTDLGDPHRRTDGVFR